MTHTLEIVEGPHAGTRVALSAPLVIGRDAGADLVLDDEQVSRRHARVVPDAAGAIVEDLESTNGTFLNHNQVHGRASFAPGDELVVGVSVLQLRSPAQVAAQPSAVRSIPPALAVPERAASFVRPVVEERERKGAGVPELDRLVDERTKGKARLAPLALFVLAALVVVIYLGVR